MPISNDYQIPHVIYYIIGHVSDELLLRNNCAGTDNQAVTALAA